jgi:hypothetical protein
MTPPDRPHEDDATPETAAALRRAWRDATADDAGPRGALDDAILAASRRAVAAGPVALGSPAGALDRPTRAPVARQPVRRWAVPASLAAMLCVAAIGAWVSITSRDHLREYEVAQVRPEEGASAPTQVADAGTAARESKPANDVRSADRAEVEPSAKVPMDAAPMSRSGAPVAAEAAKATSESPAVVAEAADARSTVTPNAVSSTASAARPGPAEVAQAAEAPARDGRSPDRLAQAEPVPPPVPPSASRGYAAEADAAASNRLDAATPPSVESDPDAWLARIAAQWRRGEHAAARTEFARFRIRYPDHPLPLDFPVSAAERTRETHDRAPARAPRTP